MDRTALHDYVTPVSVDTFGRYPGKKPGDRFEVMYNGRVFAAEVMQGTPRVMPNGSILRDVRFRQVEGPVGRMFAACPRLERPSRAGAAS